MLPIPMQVSHEMTFLGEVIIAHSGEGEGKLSKFGQTLKIVGFYFYCMLDMQTCILLQTLTSSLSKLKGSILSKTVTPLLAQKNIS